MKKTTIFLSLLIAILSSSLLYAQSHEGYYMHVDYVQIEKNNIRNFEEQITSTLKPIQKARINSGSIKEWYIYRVAYPGAQNSPYNHVVISIGDDLKDFEDLQQQISDQFSEETRNEMMENYYQLLSPNHSELWSINNSVLKGENSKPSRYFMMDYMDVPAGMEYAYQMMEDEIARPIHEHRMELEQMNGWELYGLIVPGGTEYGYNFATGNFYESLNSFEFGFTEEIIRQSHPDTDVNEINDNIDQTRDLVRSEVWELIDYVK